MLTTNELNYLSTIPDDKIAVIRQYEPLVKTVAEGIINRITQTFPGLSVVWIGASALGIAGQNDIDLNILSTPPEYAAYLPGLIDLFGPPVRQSAVLVTWQWQEQGYDIELYLTDENSPSLQEQVKVTEILKNSPVLRHQYEQLKVSLNGAPFKEYMRQKYEFFHQLLGL